MAGSEGLGLICWDKLLMKTSWQAVGDPWKSVRFVEFLYRLEIKYCSNLQSSHTP